MANVDQGQGECGWLTKGNWQGWINTLCVWLPR